MGLRNVCHNQINKTAVYATVMWNDPGSPWHAQIGGPLLCATDFCMGGKVKEDVYCLEKEKCFAGQLLH